MADLRIVPKLLDRRGRVVFSVSIDDVYVAAETYRAGDGDERRRVARRWATNHRIRNGRTLTAEEFEEMLLAVETEALAIMESDDGGTGHVSLKQAASFTSDTRLAELAWNAESGEADFIVYDRVTAQTSRTEAIEATGGTIIVPTICSGIVTPGGDVPGSVYLPTEADLSGEDEDHLRETLRRFIDRYVELPGNAAVIAVEYVLLTWLHDAFDELPYLAFRTADVGRGKSRALETVGALCYRPLFAGGGSSAAATLRLIDIFGGTLVADEFDQRRDTELAAELTRILNQGFQRNRPLVKCDGEHNAPRPFRCFGPKVFALRQRLADDATETRTLSVMMTQRTRSDIPISLPRKQFDRESLAIRNRLLAWRFAYYGKIAPDPSLADPRLEDRFNQIAAPLLAVARDGGCRAAIVAALLNQQGDIAADRADSQAGEVFAAAECIGSSGGEIRPGDVAAEVNRRRAVAEGCEVDKLKVAMSAHLAGRILSRTLELPRCPKDRQGARYRLDPVRMEHLKARYADASVETSLSSQRHAPLVTSLETRTGTIENAVCDVGDVCDDSSERTAAFVTGDDASSLFGGDVDPCPNNDGVHNGNLDAGDLTEEESES